MAILSIIMGILLVLSGVGCMLTPLATFMDIGYFFAALLLVNGIVVIIKAIADKEYGVNFLFAVITTVLGLIILFVPGLKVITDGALLYIVAAWFVIHGLVTVFMALNAKRVTGGKSWIWGIVIGILSFIIGCMSFARPLALAVFIGTFIGVYFVAVGFDMIFIGAVSKK